MSHDQLFKDLLKDFFQEFMALFFPDVAERIDFARVTFVDKEGFLGRPDGAERTSDILAKVHTKDGQEEVVEILVEVERSPRSTFTQRIFEYVLLFRTQDRLPVFPIAVYLSKGKGGLSVGQHVDTVFGRPVLTLQFDTVGLPDLEADDYLPLTNPLAPALAALMKTSREGKVAQKYRSLLAMARSGVDHARLAVLTNVVETYLPLNAAETAEFAELTASPEGEEVREMVSVYEERGIEKGIEKGKRGLLVQLIERKFGPLTEPVRQGLLEVASPEEVNRLSEAILFADKIEALNLPQV